MWHLGSALEANGKNDQALLYYIKSYVTGPPDPARRSVIENVYKKVNGTLEGLDDKIGPSFATGTATPNPWRGSASAHLLFHIARLILHVWHELPPVAADIYLGQNVSHPRASLKGLRVLVLICVPLLACRYRRPVLII